MGLSLSCDATLFVNGLVTVHQVTYFKPVMHGNFQDKRSMLRRPQTSISSGGDTDGVVEQPSYCIGEVSWHCCLLVVAHPSTPTVLLSDGASSIETRSFSAVDGDDRVISDLSNLHTLNTPTHGT